MAPNSHCFGEHLESSFTSNKGTGLHLWLTDLEGGDDPLRFFEAVQPYASIWEKFNTKISNILVENHPSLDSCGIFSGAHFLVTVELNRQGTAERHSFTYTAGDALQLYNDFIKKNINIVWLTLIKFNAMSGTIGTLPKYIKRSFFENGADSPSIPELIISDGYFRYGDLPFERLGSRSSFWGDPNHQIVRGGGVRGWGFGRTSTNWALPRVYDKYMQFL
jgi:hypothetical protein